MVIGVAGIIGWRFLRTDRAVTEREQQFRVSRTLAVTCLVIFAVLLLGMPLLQRSSFVGEFSVLVQVFDSFYRAGSLVFGGGHVVLPLLQELVVAPGWVSNAEFVAGYGAAQAVPGPLFTFSAYLGTTLDVSSGPTGWAGGLLALAAIFLPSFLLVMGAAPFWDRLRSWASFGGALRGINAAVVGLLLAALYDPGVDQRHPRAGGLRFGAGCAGAAGRLEVAAVAGGGAVGPGRAGVGVHRLVGCHSLTPL